MRILRSAAFALGALVAATLIAACGGGSRLQPEAIALHRSLQDAFLGVRAPGKAHPDDNKSWISPDVQRAPRLFWATDYGTGDIYIYTLPAMALKGTITGLSGPQGECTDRAGHIFVAETNNYRVLEYERTGTLVATYIDLYGLPVSCAVNPKNGDLAVVDIFGAGNNAPGQVLIYSSPSSTPTVLTNPSECCYYFADYDSSGDLWEDGLTKGSYPAFILSHCGSSRCRTIKLSGGTIYFPGTVQWDGVRSTWVVFDQHCGGTFAACSYPVSASGVLGAATTYDTYNGGSVCDLVQGVIAANGKRYVVGQDDEACGSASSTNDRWGYTGGGTPTNYATVGSYSAPDGAAVSTK